MKEFKNYRVSGYLDEIGAVQGDFKATSKEHAMELSEFDEIINVSEIE